MAEVCVALDDSRKDKLDLVFYHEGIKAKASVGYNARVGGSSTPRSGKLNVSDSIAIQSVQDEDEKEWVLQEPLSKEKSTYRVSFG
ncbi:MULTISPECIES: hypothetical protein [Photorhabdus]|uniref:hypothetical protein n=1 Tax=Photorhabdus TaxID=29487 RepID=UPI0002F9DA56|nr:hypothetical protein [Photorhabdus asymbiotica]